MKAWMRSVLGFVGVLTSSRRPTTTRPRTGPSRRPSVVEALERREVLSGAGVPFASIPAVVTARGEAAQVVLRFDAGELASDRATSVVLGLYARPAAGSSLAPNISGVESASGRQVRVSLPQRGSAAAAKALFLTSVNLTPGQAQDIAVDVVGLDDKVGNFVLEAFLPGDANGDGAVDAADLAQVQASYGSASGQANFDPAADFNGDGRIGCIDQRLTELNQGARAAYSPVVIPSVVTPPPALTPPPVVTPPVVTPPPAPTPPPVVTTPVATTTPVVLAPVQTTTPVSTMRATPVMMSPVQATPMVTPAYSQTNAPVPVYLVPATQASVPAYAQAAPGYLQSNAPGPVYYIGQPVVQAPGSVSISNQATVPNQATGPGVVYYYGQPVVQAPGANQVAAPGTVYYYSQPVVQAASPGQAPRA